VECAQSHQLGDVIEMELLVSATLQDFNRRMDSFSKSHIVACLRGRAFTTATGLVEDRTEQCNRELFKAEV
jgi:hypothetical protein